MDEPRTNLERRAFLARSGVVAATLVSAGLLAPGARAAKDAVSAAEGTLVPPGTLLITCMCAADDAVVQVADGSTHHVSFRGFMSVTPGPEVMYEDCPLCALEVAGHETVGFSETLGVVRVSHDERRGSQSYLRALVPGTTFPAIQEMFVNIKVTVDALPGVVLRSVEPGVLRNPRVESMPPKNATYKLMRPIELESEANPGTVLARILSYQAVINPSS